MIFWYSGNIKVHGVPCTGMWFRVAALSSFWNVHHPSSIANFTCQLHQGAPTACHPSSPPPAPGWLCCTELWRSLPGPASYTMCRNSSPVTLIGPICISVERHLPPFSALLGCNRDDPITILEQRQQCL